MREPPVVFLLLILGATGAALALGPSPLPVGLRLAALALVPIGAGIHWIGWRAFHARGTTVATLARPTELVTDGIYRWTRNPMYLGGLLITAGWVGFLGHPPLHLATLSWIPLAEYLWIRPEERLIAREFREAWLGYRSRVRRWL